MTSQVDDMSNSPLPVVATDVDPAATTPGSVAEVGLAALKLGLTSFGGPIAHLGYFRDEYVVKRRWLDEATFADLVALCQFLPGPASSQVGIGIGTMRAGMPGGLAAWLGFTLPSAIAMTAFAFLVERYDVSGAGWVHGLKIVAVAVVAQAVWGMAQQFCTDRLRATLALLAALVVLLVPTAFAQVGVIAGAGLIGWRLFPVAPGATAFAHHPSAISRRVGIGCLLLFLALLLGLPFVGGTVPGGALDLVDRFYRVGSLVFGGGHVVLPLLQTQVVATGWVTDTQFLAGYGAAQAVPGPLFTFSAFLGAVRAPAPNGVLGAVVALAAIFLPSFLLIWGTLPFWDALRAHPIFRGGLAGINAAVVGILLAALYTPVWTSAVQRPADFGLALVCLGLLMIWRWAPWQVVIVAALGGQLLAMAL
jgi:chromate transporter